MLSFLVSNKLERIEFVHRSGAIRLGREPKPVGTFQAIQDQYVSAEQLLVEELPDRRVRLANLSQRVRIELADGTGLEPGASREVPLPARLVVGRTLVEIAEEGPPGSRTNLGTVARPLASTSPARAADPAAEPELNPITPANGWSQSALAEIGETPAAERLARWFETVVTVQRAAASSDAFFLETARAVVELIGLDCGLILSRGEQGWAQDACFPGEMASRVRYSRTILDLVCNERRTYFMEANDHDRPMKQSLAEVATVVASPVFSGDGRTVVGAVYGVRIHRPGRPGGAISALEAQLVQVLAAAVGAGLARRESELSAARRHVQFEQFFSSELARELDRDPSLLEGHDREVTILSSDIRGFSRMAERLGPRETCLLVNHVLERLTAKVLEHGGVVVDYVGDGMLAMWNAPVEQPDHAVRACLAAQAILAELPGIDLLWRERLGGALRIGIGINTGIALVGNTGSPQKFKYGPLGHTVNLVSRVEGATRHFGVPVLITGSTRAKLGEDLATRRLRRVRVAGIDGAVELFELLNESEDPGWRDRRDAYESGLALYESRRFAEACRVLYPLMATDSSKYDRPTLTLVGNCIDCLKDQPTAFDPVLDLIHK